MRTKRFRLLTVLLAAVMLVALSLNIMAAKGNAVTKDGLTVQLFTDKDAYKANESVKATVRVDNQTGAEVIIHTSIDLPDGVKLASGSTSYDAILKNGESWTNTDASDDAPETGDSLQIGMWMILVVLSVCSVIALLVYGKNGRTWLSMLLCIIMIGGMAVVPAQAADISGSIEVTCPIQVDGKDTEVVATVNYFISNDGEESSEESTEASTEAPSEEVTEPSSEASGEASTEVSTEAPSEEATEPSSEAPSEEPSEPSTDAPGEEPTEPTEPTPVNGYVKVIKADKMGRYGTNFTGVSTGDTVVMDVALRVESDTASTGFYSNPEGTTKLIFHTQEGGLFIGDNKVIDLPANQWIKIRVVSSLTAEENVFILYAYDETNEVYVKKGEVTKPRTADPTLFRFMTSDTLLVDDYAVYTTADTDYTQNTLTAGTEFYKQDFDTACWHDAACPAAPDDDDQDVLNVTHISATPTSGAPGASDKVIYKSDEYAEELLGDMTALSPYVNVIYVDGEKQKTDVACIIEGDEALVSADTFEKLFGVKPVISGDNIVVGTASFTVGSKEMMVDSQTVAIEAAPRMVDNQMMIPARAYGINVLGDKFYDDEHGMFLVSDSAIDVGEASGSAAITTSTYQEANLYLFFNRYTKEELTAKLMENLGGDLSTHPRILANADDFARLRQEVQTDPYKKEIYEQILAMANEFAADTTDFVGYDVSAGNLYVCTDPAWEECFSLGLAYQLTGEEKYAERCIKVLETVCSYPDWYPQHTLGTAKMSAAVAIGFDWCYDAMTEVQRQSIAEKAKVLGLGAGYDVYYGKATYSNRFWGKTDTNWGTVVNGSFLSLAFAITEYDVDYTMQSAVNSLRSMEYPVYAVAPDGAWHEGSGYWDGTLTYLALGTAAYETAIGEVHEAVWYKGMDGMVYFQPFFSDPSGMYHNFNDGYPGSVVDSVGRMYIADKRNMPEIMKHVTDFYDLESFTPDFLYRSLALLWYDTSITEQEIDLNEALPLDKYFRGTEYVAMRQNWTSENALWVSYTGGMSTSSHAHLDSGSFVLNLDGIRWATDLGTEPAYYSRTGGNYAVNAGYTNWHYYRRKAEGHNMVVINPDENIEINQKACATFNEVVSGIGRAYTSIDLTETYGNNVNSYLRGYLVSEGRRAFTVRDEIELAKADSKLYWFMHTDGTIIILDNKTAMISSEGKQLYVQVVVEGDDVEYKLTKMSKKRLIDLGFSEAANTGEKLMIEMTATGKVNITVKMSMKQESPSRTAPETTPIAEWTVEGDDTIADDSGIECTAQLNDIKVNGKSLYGFKPDTLSYVIGVREGDSAPEITLVADGKTEIISYPQENGNTVLELRAYDENEQYYTTYIATIMQCKPLNISGYTNYQVVSADVSSEQTSPPTSQNNLRQGSFDGDMATRWTSLVKNEWIVHDLGAEATVDAFALAFASGNIRDYYFDILVSDDGITFTEVLKDQTSLKRTTELMVYELSEPVTARYIKFIGYGNSANEFNNVVELGALKKTDDWTPTPEPEPEPDPEPEMPTNGYVKTTYIDKSAMYGTNLTGVTTADTVVVDVALRVGESTGQPVLYVGNDPVTEFMGAETSSMKLTAGQWTKIRIVCDLSSTANNCMLFVYDEESGAYVNKCTATTTGITGAAVPGNITLRAATAGTSFDADDYAVYTTAETDYTKKDLTTGTVLYQQNFDAECEHSTGDCPAVADGVEKLRYNTHESETLTLEPEPTISTNGYVKTTYIDKSAMYGTNLTGVSTADTVVVDVALRVGESTGQPVLYVGNDPVTEFMGAETSSIKLTAGQWTKIRIVCDLSSNADNCMLFVYDEESGAYVNKCTATTTGITGAAVPGNITLRAAVAGSSFDADDYAVYTTAETDYTKKDLTAGTELYRQNFDAACEHSSADCPAVADGVEKLRYNTHESETLTLEPEPTTSTNGYVKTTYIDKSAMYGTNLTGVTTADTVVVDVALRVGESTGQPVLYVGNDPVTEFMGAETSSLKLTADRWTKIRIVCDLSSNADNCMLSVYDEESGAYVNKCTATTTGITGVAVPGNITLRAAATGTSFDADDYAVYTTAETDYTKKNLTAGIVLYQQNFDAECEHSTGDCPAVADGVEKLRYNTHESETVIVESN